MRTTALTGRKLYVYGIITGLIVGFLSGAFGIGAAAFIQLALMVVFGISLLHAIGICMMIVLPISAAGGLSLLVQRPPGPVDFHPDPAGPEYRRLYRS